ncbi:MAG TPA: cytochrome c-type biogenesis protein [Casimicrobiaceae bacterium]|nr:cytochrome c-type biogenesis protein [Casimicrobiaceae bacterium]
MTRIATLVLALALMAPVAGRAADAVPTEMDPVKAARAVKLAEKLRCLVCQNQSIADSNAELANDLRGQIREQIAAGKSDDEIVSYMVNRYGDFVLYQPPFKMTTVLLWAGPALLLVGGALVLARNLRRRQAAADVVLTDEEKAQAERLLAGNDRKEDK